MRSSCEKSIFNLYNYFRSKLLALWKYFSCRSVACVVIIITTHNYNFIILQCTAHKLWLKIRSDSKFVQRKVSYLRNLTLIAMMSLEFVAHRLTSVPSAGP